ncbi:MAG TPA: transposase [Phycisphaerae bacterium]|nr:transposase [Phycisphaerae bacterium]
MPQSLARVLVHVIFSTKNRQPLIAPGLRDELNAYLVGILANLDSPSVATNAFRDHVHSLMRLSRTRSLADVMEQLKVGSSKSLKTKGPALQQFHWQNGYGAFSVSPSNLAEVRDYIASQEQHHASMTFQEEFRAFLKRHGVEFDERYVWD